MKKILTFGLIAIMVSFFGVQTASAQVGYGGGGGSSGGGHRNVPTLPSQASPVAVAAVGRVLGASSFNFSRGLNLGSQGDDVTELQNRLTSEGVYNGPITGYFGPLTMAGVKAFQNKFGVSATGYVGPLTMAQLNNSQVLGATTDASAQLTALRTQLSALMQQLVQMLQAQLKAQ
jgi:peptidoglycan hydrolase-like protein with peptidoglycan-binding domain